MKKIVIILSISLFSSFSGSAMEAPSQKIRIENTQNGLDKFSDLQKIFEEEFGEGAFKIIRRKFSQHSSSLIGLLALDDSSSIVGFILYEKDYMNNACISHIAVTKQCRRQKIGTTLVSYLEKTSGCKSIKVQSVSSALPFYEELGFKKTNFNMLHKELV